MTGRAGEGEAKMIERAARDGRLWRVTVAQERSATFFVIAPNSDAAHDDADVLAAGIRDDGEWDEIENNIYFEPARRQPEHGDWVWTGGPDGEVLHV